MTSKLIFYELIIGGFLMPKQKHKPKHRTRGLNAMRTDSARISDLFSDDFKQNAIIGQNIEQNISILTQKLVHSELYNILNLMLNWEHISSQNLYKFSFFDVTAIENISYNKDGLKSMIVHAIYLNNFIGLKPFNMYICNDAFLKFLKSNSDNLEMFNYLPMVHNFYSERHIFELEQVIYNPQLFIKQYISNDTGAVSFDQFDRWIDQIDLGLNAVLYYGLFDNIFSSLVSIMPNFPKKYDLASLFGPITEVEGLILHKLRDDILDDKYIVPAYYPLRYLYKLKYNLDEIIKNNEFSAKYTYNRILTIINLLISKYELKKQSNQ